MHKTLRERYKTHYRNKAYTHKLLITLIALIALIAPIARVPKPSFALTALLLNLALLLFFLCLAPASSLFLTLAHRQTPSPPCLLLLHQKPVPSYRNEV